MSNYFHWLSLHHKGVPSYKVADRLWKRVRNPAVGKPINNWTRMFAHPEGYMIKLVGYGVQDFALLRPDNTFEFVAEPEVMQANSQSLVSAFHRWFGIAFFRHRKGLYRVTTVKNFDKRYIEKSGTCTPNYYHANETFKDSPSYYKGIKFDLTTGDCLNPRPDDKLEEIPEKRKEWRRALTKFKRGVKARIKVHALDGIVNEVWDERSKQGRWDWRQPDWSSDQWLNLLQNSIRDNEFPQELLKGIVQTSSTGYFIQKKPDIDDLYKSLDKVCNDSSIELRRRFGVFKKDENV